MASNGKKKTNKASDATRLLFKQFRSKGLIPKEWKISELTDYKAKKIRALAKELSPIVAKPDNYTYRSVSPKTAESLKSVGYKVVKTGKDKFRAILPAAGIESQHIKDGKLVITRKRRIETVYLTGGIELLENLAEMANPRELKENEFWTLKIGDKMSFMEINVQSIEDCIEYYYTVEAYLSEAQKQNLQLVKVKLI